MQNFAVPNQMRQQRNEQPVYLARCVRAQGYRNITNNATLCSGCYNSLPYKGLYAPVISHYLIIHTHQILLRCSTCLRPVQVTRDIYACSECMPRYFEYLREVYQTGRAWMRDRSPLLIHIYGDRYY